LTSIITNRTGLTYLDSKQVIYDYDGDCRLQTIQGWNNGATSYEYNTAGRPISSTNPLGQTNLIFYDNAGRVVTSVVNYDGVTAVNTLCANFNNPDPEYGV